MTIINLDKPKPPVHNKHWRNPDSQGTLIAETYDFPDTIDNSKNKYHSVYSDRLEYSKIKEVSKFLGTGEQGWSHKLTDEPFFSYSAGFPLGDFVSTTKTVKGNYVVGKNEKRDSLLREIGKIMFDLDKSPSHVRVTYWFNISNGFDCSSFEVIE